MVDLWGGLGQALWLMLTYDAELAEIALRSLYVTLSALVISCVIAFPLAAFLAVRRFRDHRVVIGVLNALMGLPPVAVGLVVYILL